MELDHPNIVKIYEYWTNGNERFIVQEPCKGGELNKWLVKQDVVNEHIYCALIKQVLEALEYCHLQGVAHRDLKSENILIFSEEGEPLVKLIDFGLSKKI